MGHVYRRPLGADVHQQLVALRDQGVTYEQIANWAGLAFAPVYRAITEGPEHKVNAATWQKLNDMRPGHNITRVGVTRRIQALQWLGYSTSSIATEVGMTLNALAPIREGTSLGAINKRNREAIADLYDRWHMVVPIADTTSRRKSVTRSRNYATQKGWLPPLAWQNIDDPDEQPEDWAYEVGTVRSTRADILRELVAAGAGISEAMRRLHSSRESLQKWCGNNDLSALYLTLTSREQRTGNGHAEEVA